MPARPPIAISCRVGRDVRVSVPLLRAWRVERSGPEIRARVWQTAAGEARRPARHVQADDSHASPGRQHPAPRRSPATGPGPALTGVFRLPPGLLGDAAKRLAWLSVFIAVLIVLVETFQQVAQPKLAPVLQDPVNRLLSLAAVLMGVAMFVLERNKLVTPSTLLGIGMMFEIVVAFSIAMVETSYPMDPDQPVHRPLVAWPLDRRGRRDHSRTARSGRS